MKPPVVLIEPGISEEDDAREKLPRDREAGIEEIWRIDPFARKVQVELRGGASYTSRSLSSGRLESRVVPGFWIDAGWL